MKRRAGPRPPTIVAIDDDLQDRQLLRRAIQAVNPEVRLSVYSTLAEALIAVRLYKPSCVVMDWSMPGHSGPAALGVLKLDPVTASVPVVVFTGAATPEVVAAALAAGAVDVIEKSSDHRAAARRLLAACGL